jgi:predicted RNase H-like HicB family nuclease
MEYPIVLYKDDNSDYGVIVPDVRNTSPLRDNREQLIIASYAFGTRYLPELN